MMPDVDRAILVSQADRQWERANVAFIALGISLGFLAFAIVVPAGIMQLVALSLSTGNVLFNFCGLIHHLNAHKTIHQLFRAVDKEPAF